MSLDGGEVKKLDRLIKKKPTVTANELANNVFGDIDKHVSDRTVRRYHRALGYRAHHQTSTYTSRRKIKSVLLTIVSKK